MDVEVIDGIAIVRLTRGQFNEFRGLWVAEGGETEDVGNGVHLFSVRGQVAWRARIDRSDA